VRDGETTTRIRQEPDKLEPLIWWIKNNTSSHLQQPESQHDQKLTASTARGLEKFKTRSRRTTLQHLLKQIKAKHYLDTDLERAPPETKQAAANQSGNKSE
jgi:hypothetical protein